VAWLSALGSLNGRYGGPIGRDGASAAKVPEVQLATAVLILHRLTEVANRQ